MKPRRVLMLASVLAALAGLPMTLLADDVHCPPDLGSVTIDGNVLVAAPCRLDGTTVNGNVHLYEGGSLIARGSTRIGGGIQAENADFIDVADAHVNGNIQLDNLVGDRSIIARSTVGGSIQLKSNRSRLEVLDNTVGADVQAFSNTGGVVVANNVIDGNLQCKSNSPPPAGGNNRVSGNKEDQCENLIPESTVTGTASNATGTAPETSNAGAGSIDPLASLLMILFVIFQMSKRSTGLQSRVVQRNRALCHECGGKGNGKSPDHRR